MHFTGFVFFLALALLIAVLFTIGIKRRGPWGSFWTFFLILFLAIWATSLLLPATGPDWFGIYWAPPLAIGLLLAFVLAAATPAPNARSRFEKAKKEAKSEEKVALSMGIFFWILLVILVLAVAIGILRNV